MLYEVEGQDYLILNIKWVKQLLIYDRKNPYWIIKKKINIEVKKFGFMKYFLVDFL